MTNRELESVLKQIESLLDLHGENSFKSRAYGRAARAIRSSAFDVISAVSNGDAIEVDGVGAGLSEEIRELVETGTSSQREDLLERTPNGLLDVLQIRGLGSKKVKALWEGLGIESLDDLEREARSGAVASQKGFGKKTAENILKAIAEMKANQGKVRFHQAESIATQLVEKIAPLDSVERIETTGRLRRAAEVFSLIEFVAIADGERLLSDLQENRLLSDLALTTGRITGRFDGSLPVRIHLTDPDRYALALHRTTGSSDYRFMFSIPLEKKGMVIEDDRLMEGERIHPVASEEDLFRIAGMQFVPPELREGIDEVPLALQNALPHLIERSDMKGLLHVHSTWSDGRNSIAEMAAAAETAGYEYLLMCDHSKAAFYANGLDEKRLEEQGKEIDEVNRAYDPEKFRVLKGIECDIMADGSLDLADDALAALDAVVISVHSSFTLSSEAQTARICRALEHPYASILAHPTGRLLLTRKGYGVDLKEVVKTASEHRKVVELNANPYRLDLDWRTLRYARRKGVPVAINPDAHGVEEISYVDIGIRIGRKAGLEAGDVLNTLSPTAFLARIAEARGA